MIQVFSGKRGSGKSKKLIEMANEHSKATSGHVVFMDIDSSAMYSLEKSIRLVCTKDYKLNSLDSLCGFLCGVISGDYDISEIYIDSLDNMVLVNADKDQEGFELLNELCNRFNIDIYININEEAYNPMPEYVKKHIY